MDKDDMANAIGSAMGLYLGWGILDFVLKIQSNLMKLIDFTLAYYCR